MRSLKWTWLLRKELRELAASRAYWVLLLMIGPLTGHAFITAVNSYADASGRGGSPAALPQSLSPLDGMFVPTFGVYDLAVTLLFPFVVIRLIAQERESGAFKLLLQSPVSMPAQLSAKAAALAIAWAMAWLPGLIAAALWKLYGGSIYLPELMNLLLGHWLGMLLAAGIAAAAAALVPGASNAAIVTLGFTVGTWALAFIAAGRGGWLQQLAAHTPAAALRSFEQGELRLNAVMVTLALAAGGWLLAGIGLRPAALGILPAVWLASLPSATWDLSENLRHSFSPAEESTLRLIHAPLQVDVNLAPEDPRLADLESGVLSKLRRVLPSMDVRYTAQTRAGLFEGSHYGEVWYSLGGRKAMTRSTAEPIVLETLYQLARLPAPLHSEDGAYPGRPLAVQPAGAAWIFYLGWPLAILLLWRLTT